MTTLKDKIQPHEIQTNKHYFDPFGHYETETSARLVVRFLANRREGWAPFTRQEIEAYYPKERRFWFNHLTTGHQPHVTEIGDVLTVLVALVAGDGEVLIDATGPTQHEAYRALHANVEAACKAFLEADGWEFGES